MDYIKEIDETLGKLVTEGTKNAFKYKDPQTQEIYYYDRKGVYHKDGKPLVFVGE